MLGPTHDISLTASIIGLLGQAKVDSQTHAKIQSQGCLSMMKYFLGWALMRRAKVWLQEAPFWPVSLISSPLY